MRSLLLLLFDCIYCSSSAGKAKKTHAHAFESRERLSASTRRWSYCHARAHHCIRNRWQSYFSHLTNLVACRWGCFRVLIRLPFVFWSREMIEDDTRWCVKKEKTSTNIAVMEFRFCHWSLLSDERSLSLSLSLLLVVAFSSSFSTFNSCRCSFILCNEKRTHTTISTRILWLYYYTFLLIVNTFLLSSSEGRTTTTTKERNKIR